MLLNILLPYAQVKDLKFTRLTEADGLPGSPVTAFLEDDMGFMWIGTTAGLCRYDGYEIKPFTRDQGYGISNDDINSLMQDRDGIIWIGTNAGGFNSYDPSSEKFTTYSHNPDDSLSIPGDRVRVIVEGMDDILWVGFDNGIGLSKFNKKTGVSINYDPYVVTPSVGARAIRSMEIDIIDENRLWLGTTSGLISFDIQKEEFKLIGHPLMSINRNGLFALSQIDENRLLGGFFHAGTGVYDISEDRWNGSTSYSLAPLRIFDVARKSQTEYWLAARKRGVAVLDLSNGTISYLPSTLNNDRTPFPGFTYTVYANEKMIWAGSKHGVSFATLEPPRFSFDSLSFESDEFGVVTDFSGSYDKIYITGIAGGLWEIDKETGESKLISVADGAPNLLYHIFEQKDKLLLVDNGREIAVFDKHQRVFKKAVIGNHIDPDNYFDQIVEWNSEYALVPTRSEGTYKLNLVSHELTPLYDPKRNSDLYHSDLLVDEEGLIWISTNSGITIYDPEKDSISFYAPSSLYSKKEKHIHVLEKQSGAIWIGTSNGLVRLKDGEEQLFTTLNSELTSNFIREITIDANENIWIATYKGISMIDPITFKIKNYDKTDGIFYESGLTVIDNDIFVGSYGGYTRFSIDSLDSDRATPTIRFGEFNVLNGSRNLEKSVEYLTSIELGYDENSISISYVAPTFRHPHKIQYSYMLEGFDSGWNNGDRRFANYTNLDAGTYTFLVKASNRDGTWGEPRSLMIRIAAPFWETWWFFLVCSLAIVGSAFTLYNLRVNALQRKADQEAQELRLEAFQKRLTELNATPPDLTLHFDELNSKLNNQLSEREFEVLKLSLDGKTNSEIGDELFISTSTVKFHLRNTYSKLGVSNRREALEYVSKTS